jgi:hypothetical protein
MDYELLYPSRFLKCSHLKGVDRTLTVKEIVREELENEDGAKGWKAILAFAEIDKQLVCVKTHALCLVQMFGRETDAWIGKRVTWMPDTVRMRECRSGPIVDKPCIRIRGSPDIAADIEFELKLPRKKAVHTKLTKTAEVK